MKNVSTGTEREETRGRKKQMGRENVVVRKQESTERRNP